VDKSLHRTWINNICERESDARGKFGVAIYARTRITRTYTTRAGISRYPKSAHDQRTRAQEIRSDQGVPTSRGFGICLTRSRIWSTG
jgi:hypothetical protein